MWFFQKVKLWGIRFFLHLELGVTNQHPKASTAQVWFLKLSPTLAVSWLHKTGDPRMSNESPQKKMVREVSLHVGQGWCSSTELRFLDFPFGKFGEFGAQGSCPIRSHHVGKFLKSNPQLF